jgi:hypothetical protein
MKQGKTVNEKSSMTGGASNRSGEEIGAHECLYICDGTSDDERRDEWRQLMSDSPVVDGEAGSVVWGEAGVCKALPSAMPSSTMQTRID